MFEYLAASLSEAVYIQLYEEVGDKEAERTGSRAVGNWSLEDEDKLYDLMELMDEAYELAYQLRPWSRPI